MATHLLLDRRLRDVRRDVAALGRGSAYDRAVRLRQATSRDDAFCFALHEASMREYVEPVYGWDADVQRAHHDRWFVPERLLIVEDDDGRAVGVLDVSDGGDHLYLARLEIMPDDQGRGLGAEVVGSLLREGREVRLDVFTGNVRARRFYERLGFVVDPRRRRECRLSMQHPAASDSSTRRDTETTRRGTRR